MRICFIETGDMRETFRRMREAEPENYQQQFHSVEYIKSLRARADSLSVICLAVDEPYWETQEDIELVAFPFWTSGGKERLVQSLEKLKPTHIVLRTPVLEAIDWALKNKAAIFPQFADSFSVSGWSPRAMKQRWAFRKLARRLNDPAITLVSNHNIGASRDLVRIGVQKDKVIPWEWPTPTSPTDFAPKSLPAEGPYKALYVGELLETKGVGDLVEGFQSQPWLLENATLDIVGKGNMAAFQSLVTSESGKAAISFLGVVPNKEVYSRMREAHIVVVPSQHAFGEGLPSTIREALTVRTPVVVTDHPAFVHFFSPGQGVTIVPEKSPQQLGQAIAGLLKDQASYTDHSLNTGKGFAAIDWPHKWADLIDHWVKGDPEGYLAIHRGQWD